MHRWTYAGNPNDLYLVDELKDFYIEQNTFPCIQPNGGSSVPAYKMHHWTYAGNPNDLYSVDELKDFYIEMSSVFAYWPSLTTVWTLLALRERFYAEPLEDVIVMASNLATAPETAWLPALKEYG